MLLPRSQGGINSSCPKFGKTPWEETNSTLPFKVCRRHRTWLHLPHMYSKRKLLKILLHYSRIALWDRNVSPHHICITATSTWRWAHWLNRLTLAKLPWVRTGFPYPSDTLSLCPHYQSCTHKDNLCKCSIFPIWVSDLFKIIFMKPMLSNAIYLLIYISKS